MLKRTPDYKIKKPKLHHRRKRMPKEGLLIQMDDTPFEWFGGNEQLESTSHRISTPLFCGILVLNNNDVKAGLRI